METGTRVPVLIPLVLVFACTLKRERPSLFMSPNNKAVEEARSDAATDARR
jgi:hypothetical protein